MNLFSTKQLYMKACLKTNSLHEMTDEELQRLQGLLRRMYIDIEGVCEKYGLRMMVAYGTVLGALRHNGFIPWDDDIDLLMPRKDYELFVNIYADELPSKYKVYAPNSKHGPIYRFAKVVDTTTRFTNSPEKATEKNGIFIDIFPLENAVLNKYKCRWIQLKACFLMYVATSTANIENKNRENRLLMCSTFSGAFNYYFRRIIGYLFCWKTKEQWYNIFDKAVSKYPESGYYMIPSGGSRFKYFMPMKRDIFLPTKRMKFDDIVVNVPNNPEMHCEMEYGNWQRIPPENERWKHFIREIKFDVDKEKKTKV